MKRGAKHKSEKNAKKMEIEERRKIVSANILAGSNYRDIAEALGVSPATICKDFKAILADWRKQTNEIIGDWVPLELGRLDTALKAIWDDVRKGDLRAIDRMVKIMERRAKLLGLDAPAKQEQVGEIILRVKRDGGDFQRDNAGTEDTAPTATLDSE